MTGSDDNRARILLAFACCLCLAGMLVACARPEEEVRGGFALHLVRDVSDPRQVDAAELATIPLAEDPIIRGEDILGYDLGTHQMTLTGEAYERVVGLFTLPVDVDGMPFVVLVGGDPVFSGAFYTPASSLSYGGVIVLHPLTPEPTIAFALGYPSAEAFEGADPRSDPRITEWLRAAGKLN